MYTPAQRLMILNLANDAVIAAVGKNPLINSGDDPLFDQLSGVFVTLKKNGDLRGCIGYPEAVMPLRDAIIKSARSAALHDPRFPPVTISELSSIKIEVTVLSALFPIDPKDVVIGTHGLVAEMGSHRGLLLPQVPVEWGWGREEFIAHTCNKAGLPMDAWKKGAKLFGFTGEVIVKDEE